MPVFYQQTINEQTKLVIWKIEEDEAFFLQHVPLQRSITHPHKRLQHLAGRYLLSHLFPGFPISLIQIADTKKPFLEDEMFHFSISHCGDFAAVIVSTTKRVGVDIELVSHKIKRISRKFVSEDEFLLIDDNNHKPGTQHAHLLTLVWSCKEAMFKWYGRGEVDFKDHMHLTGMTTVDDKMFEIKAVFKKNEDLFLDLHAHFFDELCLSYVVT